MSKCKYTNCQANHFTLIMMSKILQAQKVGIIISDVILIKIKKLQKLCGKRDILKKKKNKRSLDCYNVFYYESTKFPGITQIVPFLKYLFLKLIPFSEINCNLL